MNAGKISLLGSLALCLSLAGASMTSSAQGPKRLELHYLYYADSAHTVKVGEEWLRCNGQHTMTGNFSEYYVYSSRVCP